MLRKEVVAVFISLCLVVFADAMPQDAPDGQTGLPFIQFKNGGIRFNFGGYHAEAGLGGLLGGGRTAGGLHASAGTPWGAHAAAGLGGLLGGDNANAGGGLYARAGLGNGRHEAAAGLGGVLDGSGRSSAPVSGGLYAGATTGSHGVGVASGSADSISAGVNVQTPANGNPGNSGGKPNDESNDGVKFSGGNTNIQVIAKKPHKVKQVTTLVAAETETPKQTDPPANKEIREVVQVTETVPAASVGIFGGVSVNPLPQAQVTKTVEKVKVIGVETAPIVPPLPNVVNEVIKIDRHPHRVRAYPKWIVRKRVWGPRKTIIYDSTLGNQENTHSNIQKRQAPNYQGNRPTETNYGRPNQPNSNGGLYNDIFQIPIATLNAVNQLLNNNSA